MLGVQNAYTIQASAGFYKNKDGQTVELAVKDWQAMGSEILEALMDFTETMEVFETLTENKKLQRGKHKRLS